MRQKQDHWIKNQIVYISIAYNIRKNFNPAQNDVSRKTTGSPAFEDGVVQGKITKSYLFMCNWFNSETRQ